MDLDHPQQILFKNCVCLSEDYSITVICQQVNILNYHANET